MNVFAPDFVSAKANSSGRERVLIGTRIAPIFSTPKYSAGHGEWLAIHTATLSP